METISPDFILIVDLGSTRHIGNRKPPRVQRTIMVHAISTYWQLGRELLPRENGWFISGRSSRQQWSNGRCSRDANSHRKSLCPLPIAIIKAVFLHQIYQTFHQRCSNNRLGNKLSSVRGTFMVALEGMYANLDQFPEFRDAIRKLPFLRLVSLRITFDFGYHAYPHSAMRMSSQWTQGTPIRKLAQARQNETV